MCHGVCLRLFLAAFARCVENKEKKRKELPFIKSLPKASCPDPRPLTAVLFPCRARHGFWSGPSSVDPRPRLSENTRKTSDRDGSRQRPPRSAPSNENNQARFMLFYRVKFRRPPLPLGGGERGAANPTAPHCLLGSPGRRPEDGEKRARASRAEEERAQKEKRKKERDY